MCGILGLVRPVQSPIELSDQALHTMRDRLAHRGPDGAGLWRSQDRSVALAHRRLAVVDLSADGAQPFVSPDGRWALVYNGELYNDAELRSELRDEGVQFHTSCDTETVMNALVRWGVEALARFRGMFALGFVDTRDRTLLLARDALGIKPLYFWAHDARGGTPEVVFASEIPAILAHPEASPRPDLLTISAYLTTIRTTLADRTLFADIRTVRPGQAILFDCAQPGRMTSASAQIRTAPNSLQNLAAHEAAAGTRTLMQDSVRRHLRADVPACSLLSGGLDSSIIVREMLDAVLRGNRHGRRDKGSSVVRTYSSGYDDGQTTSDPACARRVAEEWRTSHTHAPISEAMFSQRWPEMVTQLGVPLSTPNEVAINAVARRLRADGQIVALSGEGADELFAGYELPMRQAAAFEARHAVASGALGSSTAAAHAMPVIEHDPGVFQLLSNAWVAPALKASALRPEVWRALDQDRLLMQTYADEFESIRSECPFGSDPLESHLRFHRRINLAGLLARLDTSLMLEGVEGRTPFADSAIADWAESLPMGLKYRADESGGDAGDEALAGGATKLVLREAYRDSLPAHVIDRPKASFPLPFQRWMGSVSPVVRESDVVQELFAREAVDLVAKDPASVWQLAWPMINLALWSKRWWS